MKELSPAQSIESTFNFIYNFPPTFIEETWKEEPMLVKHLTEKFESLCIKDGFASANAFTKFFFSLSSHNKQKLCEFIHNYYSQKQD